MYGGAGNDRMTVIGRIPVPFQSADPGRDVTRGPPLDALDQELPVALQLFAIDADRATTAKVADHVPVDC